MSRPCPRGVPAAVLERMGARSSISARSARETRHLPAAAAGNARNAVWLKHELLAKLQLVTPPSRAMPYNGVVSVSLLSFEKEMQEVQLLESKHMRGVSLLSAKPQEFASS